MKVYVPTLIQATAYCFWVGGSNNSQTPYHNSHLSSSLAASLGTTSQNKHCK